MKERRLRQGRFRHRGVRRLVMKVETRQDGVNESGTRLGEEERDWDEGGPGQQRVDELSMRQGGRLGSF